MTAALTWVAVVVALGAAAWLVRRLPARARARTIAVETATSLGERRSVVVVAVDGRRFLLGLAPGHIGLITELAPTFSAVIDASLGANVPEAR